MLGLPELFKAFSSCSSRLRPSHSGSVSDCQFEGAGSIPAGRTSLNLHRKKVEMRLGRQTTRATAMLGFEFRENFLRKEQLNEDRIWWSADFTIRGLFGSEVDGQDQLVLGLGDFSTVDRIWNLPSIRRPRPAAHRYIHGVSL